MICPFCGLDPYEYVHNGLGREAVGVTCCEDGRLYFIDGMTIEQIEQANAELDEQLLSEAEATE